MCVGLAPVVDILRGWVSLLNLVANDVWVEYVVVVNGGGLYINRDIVCNVVNVYMGLVVVLQVYQHSICMYYQEIILNL